MVTIRQKCIASQHRERGNGDPSSEMRQKLYTVRQKFRIGNAKIVTVR